MRPCIPFGTGGLIMCEPDGMPYMRLCCLCVAYGVGCCRPCRSACPGANVGINVAGRVPLHPARPEFVFAFTAAVFAVGVWPVP